jgi:hypothetical protein
MDASAPPRKDHPMIVENRLVFADLEQCFVWRTAGGKGPIGISRLVHPVVVGISGDDETVRPNPKC